jgi:cobalt-zinc-cadmium efflux system protein
VLLLRDGARHNLNMRSAYLHLFSDTLSSAAVIAGAVAIRYFGILWLDPALTVAIGAYVLVEGWKIVADTVKILMQYAPEGVDARNIAADLTAIEGVEDVHHVHVWTLTEHESYFEAHINTSSDLRLSECRAIKEKIGALLLERYGIRHCTLQIEYDSCRGAELVKQG